MGTRTANFYTALTGRVGFGEAAVTDEIVDGMTIAGDPEPPC